MYLLPIDTFSFEQAKVTESWIDHSLQKGVAHTPHLLQNFHPRHIHTTPLSEHQVRCFPAIQR